MPCCGGASVPMSETPSTAPELKQASFVALGAAVLGAIVIPDLPAGLSVVLVATLTSVAVLIAGGRELGRFGLTAGAIAFVLMTNFLFRTAGWVLALDVLAALGLGVVAVTRPESWREVVRAGIEALSRFPAGLGFSVRPVTGVVANVPRDRAALIGRGVLIGLAVTLVFGGLFASADQAFASIAREAVVPSVDLGLLPVRVLVGLVVAATTGALALLARQPLAAGGTWAPFGPEARARRKLDPIEWLPAVVLLDAVFGLFVAVQIAVLFGDHHHVLATEGLTYAEYARQGFFQLLAVVGLTIGVIAAVVNLGDVSSPTMRRVARISLGVLAALTSVVLMSAHFRLALYEDAYGLTRLRLLVHAAILWLALVLLLVVVAGALWRARWIPRTLLLVIAAGLLWLNAINPDAFIAKRNIDRYEATGRIDPNYLGTLSDDAVPALATLDEPLRSCVLGIRAARTVESPSVWAFNLSRERAHAILQPVLASRETCPK